MAENMIIENAKIIFKNFEGRSQKFNPAGNRNFCLVLSPEGADKLASEGWNVKTLNPREEGDDPMFYIQVSVRYNNFPPKVYMITKKNRVLLDEDTVGQLDVAEIKNVDLTLTPYEWEYNGKTGVKAYLKNLFATLEEDELESRYLSPEEDDEEVPF